MRNNYNEFRNGIKILKKYYLKFITKNLTKITYIVFLINLKMNSIVDKFYDKATKENILYAAGIISVFYIAKSTFGLFSSYFKNNRKYKEIKAILEKEKTKLMADQTQFSKFDLSYLLYLKILNQSYRKEFCEFNKNRLKIFNADNIYKYINCVEQFIRDLKFIEQDIFKIIFDDLKIDSESSEINFNCDKINIK